MAKHAPAIDARHHDVERDHIGRGRASKLNRLLTIIGMQQAIAFPLQRILEQVVDGFIVIDDQNRELLAGREPRGTILGIADGCCAASDEHPAA